MKLDIKHDIKNKCFYADCDGQRCKLVYEITEEGTLDYKSTYVPQPLRQQGIAGEITHYALEYAKANQYKIIPSCSYIKSFLDQHPEYADLIKK